MRNIQYIVVHCTASNVGWSAADVEHYFKNIKHWRKSGYHYIIERNGEVVQTTPLEEISNGVYGYNRVCINVAYIGGIDSDGAPIDNRTLKQKDSLRVLLSQLKTRFPNAIIQGHRDFPNVRKACPCFDAKNEYYDITN